MGHQLGKESIYKQYTYAKNVIQWNINLFLDDNEIDEAEKAERDSDMLKFKEIRLRSAEKDSITEGYNIIPNFFISAFVGKERKYNEGENIRIHTVKKHGADVPSTHISYQFENRLFDRDTLILSHYDVNFLYVIYLYAREKTGEKIWWKDNVRKIFRDEIRRVLQERFHFYAMTKKYGVSETNEDFLKANFKLVNGKIFQPFSNSNYYLLALNKTSNDNMEVRKKLEEHFDIVECGLGENPVEKLQAYPEDNAFNGSIDDYVVIGNYHDEAQKNFILENKLYYARLELREGRFLNLGYEAMVAKYLLLYKNGEENELYRLEGNGPRIMTNAQLKNEVVTDPKDVKNYICYPLQKKTPEKNVDLTKFTAVQGGIYFRTLREILNGNQQ